MSLDPRVRAIVRFAGLRTDDVSTPMSVRRAQGAAVGRLAWLVMPKGPDPAATIERMVPVDGGHIRVRIHHPHGPGPHPLYIFLHGGGWCVGTLHEREARCRAISAGASCTVASVDYRLAPENQYPTPPEDCYAALCWLVEHAAELGIDADRVAIGGESAGANLAAVVCLMSRDRGGPTLCHQWLDVPATDATLSQAGHHEVGDGYLLDAATIDNFFEHYVADPARATEPYCSPLLADDLSGLPPAWIMTAEYDRLRGDGEAYAAALNAAGVAAHHVRLAGHVHSSFALTRIVPSAAAYERSAIAALAAAFVVSDDPNRRDAVPRQTGGTRPEGDPMPDTASKILLVAGMANLLVGALSGIPMALVRQNGATVVPKYLTMVHLGGLMHGPILISIAVALTISTLTPWLNTTAAIVLAAASALLIAKDVLNWRQEVTDEFAEESAGLRLGQLFGPLHIVGLGIASAGVVSGL